MTPFAPDFGNLIDLPGAGPCPRPVDLDRAKTGFGTLKSLRIYRFPAGAAIDGEAEGDEVLMALVAGAADVTLFQAGAAVGEHRLRTDGGERALYLPPHAAYRLTATTECDVAYARTQPAADRFPAPRGFEAHDGDVRTGDYAIGMTLTVSRAGAGATIALDPAGERLVHVRGGVALGDRRIEDWHTLALPEEGTLSVIAEATILTVAARTGGHTPSRSLIA